MVRLNQERRRNELKLIGKRRGHGNWYHGVTSSSMLLRVIRNAEMWTLLFDQQPTSRLRVNWEGRKACVHQNALKVSMRPNDHNHPSATCWDDNPLKCLRIIYTRPSLSISPCIHSSFFYKHHRFCLSLAMLNFLAIWASKNAYPMLKIFTHQQPIWVANWKNCPFLAACLLCRIYLNTL